MFDQGKAVLPGVTVTVTNQATGITRDTVTGAEGRFVIPTLLPGTYTVRAELSGFQTQTREGFVLRIGQELTLDLTMAVAGVAENVTVTAEAPIVEVTASRIGAVVTDREIDSLPSQGRNHLSLMQLVPGLVPDAHPGRVRRRQLQRQRPLDGQQSLDGRRRRQPGHRWRRHRARRRGSRSTRWPSSRC